MLRKLILAAGCSTPAGIAGQVRPRRRSRGGSPPAPRKASILEWKSTITFSSTISNKLYEKSKKKSSKPQIGLKLSHYYFTTLIFSITISSFGRSFSPTSTLAISSTMSIPSTTCPKTVCFWSSQGVPPFSI
jgi:hypothetical protein